MPLGHRFTVRPSAHLSTYLYRFFSDFSDFVAQFRTLICLSSNFQDMDYSILTTRRSRRLAITLIYVLLCIILLISIAFLTLLAILLPSLVH